MVEAASPPLPPAANGAPRVTVPPPAQGPRVVNLAALAREYVMGGHYQAAADFLRSLPQYIDDVSRDLRPDIYDEMLRTDPVISSSARMVKQSILSDGITLRPAVDDEDDPLHDDAKAVCDFCTRAASNLRTPAEEVSEDLLSGMFLGNKLAEQVYAEMDPGEIGLPPTKSGKPARLWTLDRVKPKPRESVRPVVDAYGNFVAVQARIPGDGLLSAAGAGQQISDPKSVKNLLPRSKFAAFVWEPRDSDPRGTSILRPCYTNWWQKLQVLGSWLQWLAQCATPMLIGVVGPNADAQAPVDAMNNPTGATPVDPVQQLLNLLIQARSGNALALPTGTTVQWLTPPGRADQFVAALRYHDDCMTRAITLQTLATQDSEHNTRAASQVHQDTLGVGVRKARGVLGRVWTWDVWYWLTFWNFGKAKADALCPRAVLAPVEQHDRQSQLPAYASVGYQLAPSQLQAVDEELGLPQRTPEEARPPEPQPLPSGQEAPPGGGKGGPGKGNEAPFADEGGGHWVTIQGTHVFVSGGKVVKGPAALVGHDPDRLPPRPDWHREVYRPPGGRYLGRKAEAPEGMAHSAALDLGDHARYVWNALADTRDPAERRQAMTAALEEFRHESHATLHDLARRLGDTPMLHAAADREAARLHKHLGKVASSALAALEAAGKDRTKVKEARKDLRRELSSIIDVAHARGGRVRDPLAQEAADRVLRAAGREGM